MKRRLSLIVSCWTLSLASAAAAGSDPGSQYYCPTGRNGGLGANILLQGTPRQIGKFSEWLDRIAEVPKGLSTLQAIAQSGHRLTTQHSKCAMMTAGRALGPMTADLINGKGASVEIMFNAHIPDSGSHMVYDADRQLIEYTAIQNLYHELAHAMHMMKGTWCYFASERQAIEEENAFREDLARLRGQAPARRSRSNGVPVSNVDEVFVTSEWYGPYVLRVPDPMISTQDVYATGVSPRARELRWHGLVK